MISTSGTLRKKPFSAGTPQKSMENGKIPDSSGPEYFFLKAPKFLAANRFLPVLSDLGNELFTF